MASTAASKVLGTYELLELILQHEPTMSVALHRRVNRTWKYIIQRSRILQQKLFLAPEPLRHVFERVETKHRSTSTGWKIVRVGDSLSPNLAYPVVRLHPLLRKIHKRKESWISYPADPFKPHLRSLLKFVKSGCADMLVSQPPVNEIILYLQYGADLCDGSCYDLWYDVPHTIATTVHNKGGVKLLAVVAKLFDLLDKFSELRRLRDGRVFDSETDVNNALDHYRKLRAYYDIHIWGAVDNTVAEILPRVERAAVQNE